MHSLAVNWQGFTTWELIPCRNMFADILYRYWVSHALSWITTYSYSQVPSRFYFRLNSHLLWSFFSLLEPLRLVGRGEVVKQPWVHLHEGLEHVVDERHDGLVPVLLGDAVQRGEHDRHDHLVVLLDQGHDVLVVPEVQRALSDLEKEGARKAGRGELNALHCK